MQVVEILKDLSLEWTGTHSLKESLSTRTLTYESAPHYSLPEAPLAVANISFQRLNSPVRPTV
ncbi:hypothetical protein ACJJIF_19090 [Microbulbifer sp. SSSA002]|uniref:hypothetical protein n=1 Tax=Microbulbifer sp. SSSA002 TaxID=3243376 RepID=UPI00403A28D7